MLSPLLDPGATAVKELAYCHALLEQTFEKVETDNKQMLHKTGEWCIPCVQV